VLCGSEGGLLLSSGQEGAPSEAAGATQQASGTLVNGGDGLLGEQVVVAASDLLILDVKLGIL
jgi:hypothetical protein